MASADEPRVLALAAAMQCLVQVRDVATDGNWDPPLAGPCIGALLREYDGDVQALYGGVEALAPGLREFAAHFTSPHDPEMTRLLVTVMQLERRLMRQREVLGRLTTGLRTAANQAEFFEPMHENVVHALGHLYTQTLSGLRPRIIVRGERNHLEDPFRAALIRSLLLAAVRSASLWRASGGNRLGLILGRRRLVGHARHLLAG